MRNISKITSSLVISVVLLVSPSLAIAAITVGSTTLTTDSTLSLQGGNVGIGTTAPGKALEINSATGADLRLTYNDTDGSAVNYSDLSVTSGGDLTVAPSGGDFNVTGNADVSGHIALGNSGVVDTISLVSPGAASAAIMISDSVTSMTSGYSGIINDILLNPSGAPSTGYGMQSYLHTNSANAQNFGELVGNYQELVHEGSGSLNTMYAYKTYMDSWGAQPASSTYGYYAQIYGGTNVTGGYFEANKSYGTTAGNTFGTYSVASNARNVASGTDQTFGHYIAVTRSSGSGGTFKTYGQYIQIGLSNGGAATTEGYGIYIQNVTGADTNYAIYSAGGQSYFAGNIGIGIAVPTAKLEVKDGHYASSQTTLPTESVVTYTQGTVAAGSTDTKGQFTVTTTAATGSVTLLFNIAYVSAPTCVVSPASANTQVDADKTYVTTATNGLTINYNQAPTANLQTWNYICMQ